LALAPVGDARAQTDPTWAETEDVYLLATFFDENTGLRLATSPDGLAWENLHGGRPLLVPRVGGKLMRDPCLHRGPDGTFHLVWTLSWQGRSIGYARSRDLFHWSDQQEIVLMGAGFETGNTWAPEIRYDRTREEFMLYWSASPDRKDFKTYCTTTRNFRNFTPTRILFDPGYGQIDASILEDNGQFVLFFKHPKIGLQIALGNHLQGPYEDTKRRFADQAGDFWEGPWAIRIGDAIVVYADKFRSAERMGAWRSRDLIHWDEITSQTTGLRGLMHGSVLRAPASIVRALR
jgi:hypothetical protein